MTDWESLTSNKLFLTDLGQDQSVEVEGQQVVLGRYAVWAPIPNSDRLQVVEVGSDLEALAAKYDLDAAELMVPVPPEEVWAHG